MGHSVNGFNFHTGCGFPILSVAFWAHPISIWPQAVIPSGTPTHLALLFPRTVADITN